MAPGACGYPSHRGWIASGRRCHAAMLCSISTRSVDELLKHCACPASPRVRSAVCARRLTSGCGPPRAADRGNWPYLWIDATYGRSARPAHRISRGDHCGRGQHRRPARGSGLAIGASEARPSGRLPAQAEAPRPGRVKLVISDAHEASRPRSPACSASLGSAAGCTSAQRAGPCRQEWPARGRGLTPHRPGHRLGAGGVCGLASIARFVPSTPSGE